MAEYNSILELLADYKNSLHESKEELMQRIENVKKDLRDCDVAINAISEIYPIKADEDIDQPATTERLPKAGDQLVWIGGIEGNLEDGKTYSVFDNAEDLFTVKDGQNYYYTFNYKDWKKSFRFADEEETTDTTTERLPKKGDVLVWVLESLTGFKNGASYTVIESDKNTFVVQKTDDQTSRFGYGIWKHYFHFADETKPKLPYRIKTRQEMIDGGAVECEDGSIWPSNIADRTAVDWAKDMDYLQGMELETNEEQFIPSNSHPIVSQWRISTWMITENN